jgi:hypothetical protein
MTAMKYPPVLSKLITVAKTARHKIEALAVVEGGQPHLMGYCAIAARYIEMLANKQNIRPIFVCGYFNSYCRVLDEYSGISGHCWVELDDYIVDITATQFKNTPTKINRDFGKKVYVSTAINPHYTMYAIGNTAKNIVKAWYVEPIDEICDKADTLGV